MRRGSSSSSSSLTVVGLLIAALLLLMCVMYRDLEADAGAVLRSASSASTKIRVTLRSAAKTAMSAAVNMTGVARDSGSDMLGFVVHQLVRNSSVPHPAITTMTTKTFYDKSPLILYFSDSLVDELASRRMRSRDLVLGMAENTDEKYLAVFCASLRATSRKTEAVLLLNIEAFSPRMFGVLSKYRIYGVLYNRSALEPAYMRSYHPSSLRWVLFDRLLNNQTFSIKSTSSTLSALGSLFSRVLFIDARDTFFQLNPFTSLPRSGKEGDLLLVFGEQLRLPIEMCGWNSNWILDCFGKRRYDNVRSAPILCSGVSLGSARRAAEYTALMGATLLGNSSGTHFFPNCERNGVDQGVHNLLVHSGQLPHAKIQFEEDFPVVNLQSSQLSLVTSDAENVTNLVQLFADAADKDVFCRGGKTKKSTRCAALVHQYDRHYGLQTRLLKEFVPWVNSSDPESEWRREQACSNFNYTAGPVDELAGFCDMDSARVLTAASCCGLCLVRPGCMGFVFASGHCFFKNCFAESVTRPPAPALQSPLIASQSPCYQSEGHSKFVNARLQRNTLQPPS